VVGAEAISKILDWSDRSTAVLFGDGAGAAVVSTARGAGHILGFELGGDGSGGDFLSLPAGGTRMPATHETVDAGMHFVHMDGKEIYKFATRIIAPSAEAVLARCGKTVDDVDLFVPHQANLRIIEAGAKKLGIPMEKVYTNLQRYGNTSSASMPMCLTEARQEGRLRDGDLVLLMGFGGGLTWGSGLLEWGS
jgi:3-oxoacyl-[acyl-carrier-protein] synthase-3